MKRICLIALMLLCGISLQAQYNTGIGDGYASDNITKLEIPVSLLTPANLSQSIALNPTLTWETSTNSTKFRLQISLTNNFASPIVNEEVSGTTKELSNLLNNIKYFWRVQALDQADTNEWSSIWNFKTIALPNNVEDEFTYFSISPQPVRDEAEVTFNSNTANADIESGISIELYDLRGALVATYNFPSLSEGTNKLRFDVRNLVSGMYNVIIKSGTEVHQAKMIKVD